MPADGLTSDLFFDVHQIGVRHIALPGAIRPLCGRPNSVWVGGRSLRLWSLSDDVYCSQCLGSAKRLEAQYGDTDDE